MSKLKGSKARSSRSTSKCSVLLEKLEPLAHSILGGLDKLSTRVDEISSRVDGQLELKLTRLFDLLQNERNPLSSNLGLRYGADTITYLDILSLLARKKITVPGDDLKKFTRAIQDRVMDCLKAHNEGNNGDEEEEGYEAVREEIERALEVGNRHLGSFEQYGFSSQLLSPYMPRLIVPSDDDDEESEEEEVDDDVSKESLRIFEDISAFGCSLARGGGGCQDAGQDDDHDDHEETVTRSVDGPDSKKNTTVKNLANYEESSFLDSALSSSPVMLKGGMLKGVSRRDARRDCKRLDFDALVSPVQEGSSSPAGKSRWSDAAFRAEKFLQFQEAEKKKNMKKEKKDRVEEDDETDDDGEEDDKTLVAKVKGKGEKLAEVEVIPKKAAAKGKSVASASSGPSTSTGTTSTTSGGPNKKQSKRLKSRSTTSSSSALPISTASTTTTTTLRKLPTLSDLSLREESGVEVQDHHSTEDPGLNVGVPYTMSDPIPMNPNRANGSTRMSESSRSLRKRKEKVDYKAMSSSGKPKRSSKKR